MPIFTSDPAKEVYYAPFSGSPFAALSTSDEAGRVHLFAAAVHSSSFTGPLRMAELPGDALPIGWNGSLPNASLCGLGDFRGRGSYQVECFDPDSVLPFFPNVAWRITTFDVDADGRDDLLAYNFGTDESGHFHVTGGRIGKAKGFARPTRLPGPLALGVPRASGAYSWRSQARIAVCGHTSALVALVGARIRRGGFGYAAAAANPRSTCSHSGERAGARGSGEARTPRCR